MEQLEEQLSVLKSAFFDVSQCILALTEDTTVQTDEETRISKGIFDPCLHIRRLSSTMPPVPPAIATSAPTAPSAKGGGIRLLRIEALKFDGTLF